MTILVIEMVSNTMVLELWRYLIYFLFMMQFLWKDIFDKPLEHGAMVTMSIRSLIADMS